MPDDASTLPAPMTIVPGRKFFESLPAEDLRFLLDFAGPLLVTDAVGRIWWLNNSACELLQTDIDSACDFPRSSWASRISDSNLRARYLDRAAAVAKGNGESAFTHFNDLLRPNGAPVGVEVTTYRVPSAGPFRFFIKCVTPMSAAMETSRAISIMSSQLARIENSIAEDAASRIRIRGYMEKCLGFIESHPKLAATIAFAILSTVLGPGVVGQWRDFIFGPRATPVYQAPTPPVGTTTGAGHSQRSLTKQEMGTAVSFLD